MSATLTQEQTRLINEAVFEKLSSSDSVLQKEAVDAINDFTRIQMRETGFFRKILPPVTITNDELDRQTDTDKPVKIVDKEPDSPAAISIPFATLPRSIYIRGPRYPVMLDRIVTPRFTKDVDELRTWIMDIRQVLSDNAIKDMLAEEDGKFISACNTALVGQDATTATSGVAQWQSVAGGITRESLWDSMKILPSTSFHLEVHTILINHITIKDVAKFGYDEMGGGEMSANIMKDGWTEENFLGAKWIITIKRDLVPNNTTFMFADPKFIGKHYSLEETTMYIRREAYMLEFFAYETCGGTIGHTGSIARADFT